MYSKNLIILFREYLKDQKIAILESSTVSYSGDDIDEINKMIAVIDFLSADDFVSLVEQRRDCNWLFSLDYHKMHADIMKIVSANSMWVHSIIKK